MIFSHKDVRNFVLINKFYNNAFQDLFFNVSTHHTPAYDFAPNPDKQWILRNSEKMLPIQRSFTDMLMTKRLQTLQSVDSGVEQVVKELKKTGA